MLDIEKLTVLMTMTKQQNNQEISSRSISLKSVLIRPNTTLLTSVGGPTLPVYVQGLLAATESELASKEGNLSFSVLSTVVVPTNVEGDVVDKTHCTKEEVSLVFAAQCIQYNEQIHKSDLITCLYIFTNKVHNFRFQFSQHGANVESYMLVKIKRFNAMPFKLADLI